MLWESTRGLKKWWLWVIILCGVLIILTTYACVYVHVYRHMCICIVEYYLDLALVGWWLTEINSAFFTPKTSYVGPKGDIESQTVRKNRFPLAHVLLLFCWAQLSSCCCYEEMIVYISDLVCIGKLAALPCNSSLVSQGTMHLELQGKGLYRVIKAKYCIPLSWIKLITEVLHELCRNMQKN